jgi:hypothetical protein
VFIIRSRRLALKPRLNVLREAIYNRRYNKGTDIGFTTYYDEFYLPWLQEKKRSRVVDAESRVKRLKEFFGNRSLREITRRDVERFQGSLRGKKTRRQTPRKGATVNRYIYLLSAVFSRAALDEVVDFTHAAGSSKNQKQRESAI